MDGAGKRVLVVDDDPLVRWMIVDGLREAGFEVVEAVDGEDGLEALRRDKSFDVLLTDITMPRLDGWSLAEQARALHPALPVLYVSGWSDQPLRPLSNSRMLAKPFRSQALVSLVTMAVNDDLGDLSLLSHEASISCPNPGASKRRPS